MAWDSHKVLMLILSIKQNSITKSLLFSFLPKYLKRLQVFISKLQIFNLQTPLKETTYIETLRVNMAQFCSIKHDIHFLAALPISSYLTRSTCKKRAFTHQVKLFTVVQTTTSLVNSPLYGVMLVERFPIP